MNALASQAVKPSRKRLPVQLSAKLDKNLLAYAVAASAAGLGAAAQSAEAKIVYTKSDIPITVDAGPIYLDLNHDGINDFSFNNWAQADTAVSSARLFVYGAQAPNGIWSNKSGRGSFKTCAAALPKGMRVGPKAPFAGAGVMAFFAYEAGEGSTQFGPWLKVQQAYLGFKFMIKGKVHYGWARVKMLSQKPPYQAEITGYAYETIPNKPIKTCATKGPDNASLGLLAKGATELSAWR